MKNRIFRIIKWMLLSISIIIGMCVIFINFSPQFGGDITKELQLEYAKSNNYKDGKFVNQHHSPMNLDYWVFFKEMIKKAPHRKPNENILVEKKDSLEIENHSKDITYLTWFGHSAFLLEIDGKKILIDPMLSEALGPFTLLGPKRYSNELPIEIEKLPFIDAIIISHDHYDHLDYESIQKLKNKVGRFYTPLGVGIHLKSWGIAEKNITELDWWESAEFDTLSLVCTPARHLSGRGLFDESPTLWASWVIKGKRENIFFSGDGGYDTHFKEIGEKYGPFDISLMECGQYNEDWKLIHMMPEETVLASIDLNSKLTLPIHWAGFTMAFHDWTDPVERMLIKANELNMPVTTPKIGEQIIVGEGKFPTEKWWLKK